MYYQLDRSINQASKMTSSKCVYFAYFIILCFVFTPMEVRATSVVTRCPLGWIESPDGMQCFKFLRSTGLLGKQLEMCKAMGPDLMHVGLATILDAETNEFLMEHVIPKDLKNSYVIIGLTNSHEHTEEYIWQNIKEQYDYKNWKKNEPTFYNPKNAVVMSTTDGLWKTTDASRSYHPAICEIIFQDEVKCSKHNGYCAHKCVKQNDVHRCICKEGHQVIDIHKCIATIDCDKENGGCDHICVKGQSVQHTCRCREGYEKFNFTRCFDINECLVDVKKCPPLRHCRNTIGSFECYGENQAPCFDSASTGYVVYFVHVIFIMFSR